MNRPAAVLACAGLLAAGLAGCAGRGGAARAERPAAISHVVLIKLKDPDLARALIRDCDRLLPGIPSVVSYACGPHFEMGRPNIDSDYDVGLYVGFDGEAGYRTYVDHPNHVELVGAWRPRWEWIRIYDVGDPTP